MYLSIYIFAFSIKLIKDNVHFLGQQCIYLNSSKSRVYLLIVYEYAFFIFLSTKMLDSYVKR